MVAPRLIELTENRPLLLPQPDLAQEEAEALWRTYPTRIAVEPPSFMNDHRWKLVSSGYAGYLPVTPHLQLAIRPKVPIAGLFGMLEYAYRLDPFLDGLVPTESLQELYERLAVVLARRVLDRTARGLHRAYEPAEERCAYVRGRMDSRRLAAASWDPRVHCHYQDHTVDLDDNRILAWTLFVIARSGLCREQSLAPVRRAYRQLGQAVTLEQHDARCCLGRVYNRLNQDYRPMHALCRFFLANSGPGVRQGRHSMVPFLIDMPRLFEAFVVEWLARHGAPGLRFDSRHRFVWDSRHGFLSMPDLVGLDAVEGRPLVVLDMKYKADSAAGPNDDDVHQVVFYAQALGCTDAVLVYPEAQRRPVDTLVGDIRVRTLAFALDGDLDAAGAEFVAQLLAEGSAARG